MKRETISKALNTLDDRFISESAVFAPDTMQENPERSVHLKKKRIVSLALAAALIMALGTVAYAIGVSIHRQRQVKLREQLKIEENAVVDYEDAVLPEEESSQAEGVTLLSTVNDGEFQRVYVNISPVEPELAQSFGKTEVKEDGSYSYYSFDFTMDGKSFGIATPAILINTDGSVSMDDIINAAYDEETRTFTMECPCLVSDDKPFDLTLTLHHVKYIPSENIYDAEPMQTFGTVTVNPTANIVRSIRFENPYPFENSVTGEKGKIIGADLSSFNVDILVTHENMEAMYAPDIELEGDARTAYFEEQLGWIQATDELAHSMTLMFSDGSSRTGFGALSSPYENGTLILHCGLGNRSINIHDVVSISIGNQTVWESK